jgi:hypothetical protein
MHRMSGGYLLLDKRGETANIIECVGGDFIVFDDDFEALLERDDHVHHRHRVQLGKASEQWRRGVEQPGSLTEIQRFTQDYLDFLDYRRVQFSAKSLTDLRDEVFAARPANSYRCALANLQYTRLSDDFLHASARPRVCDRMGDS